MRVRSCVDLHRVKCPGILRDIAGNWCYLGATSQLHDVREVVGNMWFLEFGAGKEKKRPKAGVLREVGGGRDWQEVMKDKRTGGT